MCKFQSCPSVGPKHPDYAPFRYIVSVVGIEKGRGLDLEN